MTLYDVFYQDGTMDRDVPYSSLENYLFTEGDMAVCTNGGEPSLIFHNGQWEEVLEKNSFTARTAINPQKAMKKSAMKWSDLWERIQDFERTLAYGGETAFWGDFLKDAMRVSRVEDVFALEYAEEEAPNDFASWWLSAYANLERMTAIQKAAIDSGMSDEEISGYWDAWEMSGLDSSAPVDRFEAAVDALGD